MPLAGKFHLFVGLAAIYWALWKTRNNICFDKKMIRSPTEIICSVSSFISFWAELEVDQRKTRNKSNSSRAAKWADIFIFTRWVQKIDLQQVFQMGCHFGRPSKFLPPPPNLVALYLGCQLWAPPIFFSFPSSHLLVEHLEGAEAGDPRGDGAEEGVALEVEACERGQGEEVGGEGAGEAVGAEAEQL